MYVNNTLIKQKKTDPGNSKRLSSKRGTVGQTGQTRSGTGDIFLIAVLQALISTSETCDSTACAKTELQFFLSQLHTRALCSGSAGAGLSNAQVLLGSYRHEKLKAGEMGMQSLDPSRAECRNPSLSSPPRSRHSLSQASCHHVRETIATSSQIH